MEQLTLCNNSYRVERLLGKGKGGYSYLVTDGVQQYVLKQIHHEPCDYYQFGDKLASELADYEKLSALGIPMPKLLEVDRQQERLLKEYIEGDTIYDLVLRGRMEARYIRQMEALCETLYANHLNIDYFPTNFIPREGNLVYIDYECNEYMEQWDFAHWGIHYWSATEIFLAYAKEHGHVEAETL